MIELMMVVMAFSDSAALIYLLIVEQEAPLPRRAQRVRRA